jgi:dipeptidase
VSFALWIGRELTSDGVAYLAGYGDEPSSHWLEVIERSVHEPGSVIEVGVTPDAPMPGVRSTIPQVETTARHLRVSYSYFRGVPAPLTNGGLNEHGVAVRDVWSTSRQELIDMTSRDQRGLNYSDLARIVLERATCAREGAELIGSLVDTYGYATYGGNSHLVADRDEAWVVIEFAGGRGLWCAERVGSRDVRVSRPGYIGTIPTVPHDDFMWSANFFDVARTEGWWNDGDVFDVNVVYGDGKGCWDGATWIENEMRNKADSTDRIALADVMWALRTPRLTGDTAGYGQIVPLGESDHNALRMLWHAQIGAVSAPFTPIFMGIRDVPEEFRKHRYLTTGEDARFIDRRHADRGDFGSLSEVAQGVESTRSATAVFKRLLYLVFQRHDTYLPEVTETWEGMERTLREAVPRVREIAQNLLDADNHDLATDVLTHFTATELLRALDGAEKLAAAYEVRSRAVGGIDVTRIHTPEQLW